MKNKKESNQDFSYLVKDSLNSIKTHQIAFLENTLPIKNAHIAHVLANSVPQNKNLAHLIEFVESIDRYPETLNSLYTTEWNYMSEAHQITTLLLSNTVYKAFKKGQKDITEKVIDYLREVQDPDKDINPRFLRSGSNIIQ